MKGNFYQLVTTENVALVIPEIEFYGTAKEREDEQNYFAVKSEENNKCFLIESTASQSSTLGNIEVGGDTVRTDADQAFVTGRFAATDGGIGDWWQVEAANEYWFEKVRI